MGKNGWENLLSICAAFCCVIDQARGPDAMAKLRVTMLMVYGRRKLWQRLLLAGRREAKQTNGREKISMNNNNAKGTPFSFIQRDLMKAFQPETKGDRGANEKL